MVGQLEGRVALVTGGGSGIGRASAVALAKEGAKLVVADINEAGGRQTAQQIQAMGGEAVAIRVDVSQTADVQDAVETALQTYGRLDCAHNNAGVAYGNRVLTADISEEQWDRMLAINLKGIWLCMKYEIPPMLHQGIGVIVNTASVAGLVGQRGWGAYAASKHGVIGLTKSAAMDYATAGIRVNAVCPGVIRSPMTEQGLSDPERAAELAGRHPMGRVGTPEEVAAAVVWLCSDAASFMTGHALAVDGGWVAQ